MEDCYLPQCCPTVPAVNIPGSAGANAFTFLTQSFVIPQAGFTVLVDVLDTSWMLLGLTLATYGPSHFVVQTINSPTSVTLMFISTTGDAVPGTVVPSGSPLVPSGVNGLNTYSFTTSGLLIPAPNTAVALPTQLVSSLQFAAGQVVFISDDTNWGHFSVTSTPTPTSVQLTFLNYSGDAATGATIASGAKVIPSMLQPLPVVSGGTGATTAAQALINLGAAAGQGPNGDITSLTGLTTPLPITEGGTGSITALAALSALIQAVKTGTFIATGVTPVTVANANVTANSVIIFCLKTVGGTVGAVPAVKTITPGTGFTVAGTASDTSTYNYIIIN